MGYVLDDIEHDRWRHEGEGDCDGDENDVLEGLIADHPVAMREESIAVYRTDHEAVCGLIDNPIVWRSIEALARRLIKGGAPTREEVEGG
jgi:hypothetical protein